MAGRRVSVSKMTEIIRLNKIGLSERAIARSLKCSRKTVKKYLEAAVIDDRQPCTTISSTDGLWSDDLDWPEIIAEIRRGVPIQVIWEEMTEAGKVTVQYPGFWKQLKKRMPDCDATMHRIFKPGEKAEIDYCDGIPLLDPLTGDIVKTQLFVGVLCHSRYVYAEFTLTQKSHDFLVSHVNMLEYFGGVPQTISPDNLKSAVTKAHPYDPDINPAYVKLAEHYGFAVVPARVRRPKDKAIVERAVQIFQRWFYWRVRKKTFTSLVELNKELSHHFGHF